MALTDMGMRDRIQELRSRIDHPIIDSDGHIVEFLPDLVPVLRRAGIADPDQLREMCAVAAWGRSYQTGMVNWSKMSKADRARRRVPRPSSHDFSGNPLDRATTMLPELLYQRLDEIGIDFAMIYPSLVNFLSKLADERTRRIACHDVNEHNMDQFRPFSDRMAMPAVIPMYTPDEAVEELDHAHSLGYKVALIAAYVRRYDDEVPGGLWFDGFGLDSQYDYDPVWAKATELGMPITAHGNGYGDGWLVRSSVSNYSFSHMGHFANAQEFLCRSLFMGGVTNRFPQLRFSFLEGGVAWAAMLYAAVIAHWKLRNGDALRHHLSTSGYSAADKQQFQDLVKRYGTKTLERSGSGVLEQVEEWFWASPGLPGPDDDEWEAVGITKKEDFLDRFVRSFGFGAESDDPMTAAAFSKANPLGARLQVLFSSDMGHLDVTNLLQILEEAHEGVERGWMEEGDFRDFTFANPARFFTDMNPQFFKGTRVEGAVQQLLEG